MSAPLEVTETREVEEEPAWGRKTASWAEPVPEEAEQPASSARQSASSRWVEAFFMEAR
jgi:hypothetical protein